MEAQSEYGTRCMHVFCTFDVGLYAAVSAYYQNFCIGAQSEVYQECVVGWEGGGDFDQMDKPCRILLTTSFLLFFFAF